MSFAPDTPISFPPVPGAPEELFNAALAEYIKQTGIDLVNHPFSAQLENCKSFDDYLLILEELAKTVREFRDCNKRLVKALKPTVNVVCSLSGTFGESIGLAMPPISAILGGVSFLLMAVKNVSTSYDALMELFDFIGDVLNGLKIHTSFTPKIAVNTVNVLVELLSVLALAREQIQMGRFKKFGKKLLGEDSIKAALLRLDRLSKVEAQMTTAQTLKVVEGLISNIKEVMNDGRVSTEYVRAALVAIQEVTESLHKMQHDQLLQNARTWLRAPDPSVNHNAARRPQPLRTAAWFTEGSTFFQWKTEGSALWIYGKPGCGKSVLCSNIVEDLWNMRMSGLALVLYFYFDFNDIEKQSRRALLSSLLVQLGAQSGPFCDILSRLYSSHDHGGRQPNDDRLMQCLGDMLSLEGQGTIYIIIDALDECPNKPGMPSPREEVLKMIDEVVGLRLSNLRLCITSRPEADIRKALGPLTSHSVSLHEERGQRKEISDYIESVVLSDPRMRRWRDVDMTLVIETLSEKADGMFRWAYCQLEKLCRCLPQRIRQTLDELPSTLDETYERTLLGIDEGDREYARRIFQCLAVSFRPLRAEELAEAIVVDLNTEAGPTLHAGWRPEDPEEAVLRTCSTLITFTEIDGSRVVQFSHYSVKEFLVSDRLAANASLSLYHFLPRPAHTFFAKICLGVLLQLDKRLDKRSVKNFPLAEYAARHWVEHARFEDVSYVDREMESLFDPSKPHFAAWVWLHDLDSSRKRPTVRSRPTTPGASPLHYAALCGLLGLVERLTSLRPKEVKALDEKSQTPLHAALHGGHTEVARFLLSHGADKNAQDDEDWTPLHIALQNRNLDIARLLLQEGAHLNSQTKSHRQTPLVLALYIEDLQVIRSLLEHGANVNTRDDEDMTPLHIAFQREDLESTKLLLEYGANAKASGKDQTLLHLASWEGKLEFARLFLRHGANVNARGDRNRTPLLMALGNKKVEIVRLLLENEADVNAQGDWDETPLHLASENGDLGIMSLLLEHGADVNARDSRDRTPLHMALGSANLETIPQTLLEHGADANATDIQGRTPLHIASKSGRLEIIGLLLKHSANVNAVSEERWTPLHVASQAGHLKIAKLLLENGANAKAQTNKGSTPLHRASMRGYLEVAKLLVKYGADVNASDEDRWTPLHFALEYNWTEPEVVRWLTERCQGGGGGGGGSG